MKEKNVMKIPVRINIKNLMNGSLIVLISFRRQH